MRVDSFQSNSTKLLRALRHCFWSQYNNLPPKYALWTKAIGVHLVARCVLYSYWFLDLVIRWIAMGNGWNLRQPAWLKPNDVKSLQSRASRTRQVGGAGVGVWSQWKCHPEILGQLGEHCATKSDLLRHCWIWKCCQLQRLWSST